MKDDQLGRNGNLGKPLLIIIGIALAVWMLTATFL